MVNKCESEVENSFQIAGVYVNDSQKEVIAFNNELEKKTVLTSDK